MNASVGADERLVVMLEARVSEFEKRMRQAEQRGTRTYQGLRKGSQSATRQMEADMIRSTSRINQAIAATSSQIGNLGKAFLGGAVAGAATAAVAGLTSNLEQSVKAIAALGDEAKCAGVPLDDFQRWKFVAEQNRIGIDSLVDGFKELNLRADEFIVTGAGPAAEAFNRLRFSADELKQGLRETMISSRGTSMCPISQQSNMAALERMRARGNPLRIFAQSAVEHRELEALLNIFCASPGQPAKVCRNDSDAILQPFGVRRGFKVICHSQSYVGCLR